MIHKENTQNRRKSESLRAENFKINTKSFHLQQTYSKLTAEELRGIVTNVFAGIARLVYN